MNTLQAPPDTPWGHLIRGVLIAGAAFVFALQAFDEGLLFVGSLLLVCALFGVGVMLVGGVAAGVRLGLRWRDWERSRESA